MRLALPSTQTQPPITHCGPRGSKPGWPHYRWSPMSALVRRGSRPVEYRPQAFAKAAKPSSSTAGRTCSGSSRHPWSRRPAHLRSVWRPAMRSLHPWRWASSGNCVTCSYSLDPVARERRRLSSAPSVTRRSQQAPPGCPSRPNRQRGRARPLSEARIQVGRRADIAQPRPRLMFHAPVAIASNSATNENSFTSASAARRYPRERKFIRQVRTGVSRGRRTASGSP